MDLLAEQSGKILIVDDTPANLYALEEILVNAGHQVRALPSSGLAMRSAEAEPPDLIMLDIKMPGCDGFDLCGQLKSDSHTKDIPVIFISALQETENKVRGFELGAVDYITKPFQAAEVLARVSTHLRLYRLQHQLNELFIRHRTLLDAAGEGIFGLDADCRITFVNLRALSQLGYAESALIGSHLQQLIHHTATDGSARDSKLCAIQQIAQDRDRASRFVPYDQFFRADGTAYPVEYTVSGIGRINTGPTVSPNQDVVVIFRGITERLAAERSLQEAARVFEVSGDGIILTDERGRIHQVNPAFTSITGYAATEAIGQTSGMLKSGRHDAVFYQTLWAAIQGPIGRWEGEIWNRRKDGSVYPAWLAISAIYGHNQRIVGYVAQFSDITQRKQDEARLRHRCHHDALTDLANRTLFQDRLSQAFKEHRRRERLFALLILDLDYFKGVNDTLGHPAGDQLLVEIAERIRRLIRDCDTAARLGGDEFALVLTDLDDPAAAEEMADRILEALCQPVNLQGESATVSTSIGWALYPQDGDDAKSLLANADAALYQAKNAGRRQACRFDPLQTSP